jgi:uncharacterized membrane protein (UPF0127 family)
MILFLQRLANAAAAGSPLINTRTGTIVADVIEAAVDQPARRKGLLGRSALAERHALVLAPCNAIHTFGMKFPIDVIFIGSDGCVVKIVEGLARGRFALSWDACATVELAAGAARRARISVGDRLALETVQLRTAVNGR